MLYRITGLVGSGVSSAALDKIVNSKYDNVLIITNEVLPKHILDKLKSYENNTGKVIVTNVTIKATEYGQNKLQTDLIMDEGIGKYDCILIDKLEGVGSRDVDTYANNISKVLEELTVYSKDNNIDVIVTQNLNADYRKYKVFDECIKEFSKEELQDDQENILIFRSLTEDNVYFIKSYERRNNLIRSFDISKYHKSS